MLKYELGFTEPVEADVTKFIVDASVTPEGGGDPLTASKTYDVGTPAFLFVERNASVSLTVKKVDSTGNVGLPSDPVTFTATDTIPPGQPGGLSFTQVSDNETSEEILG